MKTLTNIQMMSSVMGDARLHRDSVFTYRVTITGMDPDEIELRMNDLNTVDWCPVDCGDDWVIIDVRYLDSPYRN